MIAPHSISTARIRMVHTLLGAIEAGHTKERIDLIIAVLTDPTAIEEDAALLESVLRVFRAVIESEDQQDQQGQKDHRALLEIFVEYLEMFRCA